jgi:hypothetical protein
MHNTTPAPVLESIDTTTLLFVSGGCHKRGCCSPPAAPPPAAPPPAVAAAMTTASAPTPTPVAPADPAPAQPSGDVITTNVSINGKPVS